LENGRYPSPDELKDIIENEYNIKIKDLSYLYDIETKYINQAYDSNDQRDTFEKSQLFNEKSADHNEYDPKIEADYNKHVANVLLESLGDREREIVKLLFGIGCDREYTLEEVAQKFGMTRERIRQIKKTSVNKLKKVYATHDIK
jgi:RNA polymerase primary sigma factor